jgi:transcriptional regulator with XRE-family HTH domain
MSYGIFCVDQNSPAGYLRAVPSFGENLKSIRQRAKLKAKDVAERVDVARSVVSGWENDRRGLPETPTLFKLAKALNCSIEELLQGVDAEYEAAAQKRAPKLEIVRAGGSESDQARTDDTAAREILATVSKLTAAIAGALCQDNDATAEALELWTQLSPDDRVSIIEMMKGYRESGPGADGARRRAEVREPAARRRRGAGRGRRHPA